MSGGEDCGDNIGEDVGGGEMVAGVSGIGKDVSGTDDTGEEDGSASDGKTWGLELDFDFLLDRKLSTSKELPSTV